MQIHQLKVKSQKGNGALDAAGRKGRIPAGE